MPTYNHRRQTHRSGGRGRGSRYRSYHSSNNSSSSSYRRGAGSSVNKAFDQKTELDRSMQPRLTMVDRLLDKGFNQNYKCTNKRCGQVHYTVIEEDRSLCLTFHWSNSQLNDAQLHRGISVVRNALEKEIKEECFRKLSRLAMNEDSKKEDCCFEHDSLSLAPRIVCALHLCFNGLTDVGIDYLVHFLLEHRSDLCIRKLDLSSNFFGDGGCGHLSRLIEEMTYPMSELLMRNCQISHSGLHQLFEAISSRNANTSQIYQWPFAPNRLTPLENPFHPRNHRLPLWIDVMPLNYADSAEDFQRKSQEEWSVKVNLISDDISQKQHSESKEHISSSILKSGPLMCQKDLSFDLPPFKPLSFDSLLPHYLETERKSEDDAKDDPSLPSHIPSSLMDLYKLTKAARQALEKQSANDDNDANGSRIQVQLAGMIFDSTVTAHGVAALKRITEQSQSDEENDDDDQKDEDQSPLYLLMDTCAMVRLMELPLSMRRNFWQTFVTNQHLYRYVSVYCKQHMIHDRVKSTDQFVMKMQCEVLPKLMVSEMNTELLQRLYSQLVFDGSPPHPHGGEQDFHLATDSTGTLSNSLFLRRIPRLAVFNLKSRFHKEILEIAIRNAIQRCVLQNLTIPGLVIDEKKEKDPSYSHSGITLSKYRQNSGSSYHHRKDSMTVVSRVRRMKIKELSLESGMREWMQWCKKHVFSHLDWSYVGSPDLQQLVSQIGNKVRQQFIQHSKQEDIKVFTLGAMLERADKSQFGHSLDEKDRVVLLVPNTAILELENIKTRGNKDKSTLWRVNQLSGDSGLLRQCLSKGVLQYLPPLPNDSVWKPGQHNDSKIISRVESLVGKLGVRNVALVTLDRNMYTLASNRGIPVLDLYRLNHLLFERGPSARWTASLFRSMLSEIGCIPGLNSNSELQSTLDSIWKGSRKNKSVSPPKAASLIEEALMDLVEEEQEGTDDGNADSDDAALRDVIVKPVNFRGSKVAAINGAARVPVLNRVNQTVSEDLLAGFERAIGLSSQLVQHITENLCNEKRKPTKNERNLLYNAHSTLSELNLMAARKWLEYDTDAEDDDDEDPSDELGAHIEHANDDDLDAESEKVSSNEEVEPMAWFEEESGLEMNRDCSSSTEPSGRDHTSEEDRLDSDQRMHSNEKSPEPSGVDHSSEDDDSSYEFGPQSSEKDTGMGMMHMEDELKKKSERNKSTQIPRIGGMIYDESKEDLESGSDGNNEVIISVDSFKFEFDVQDFHDHTQGDHGDGNDEVFTLSDLKQARRCV